MVENPPTLVGRPGEVLEALAAFEMFRRLGFEADVVDVGIKNGNLLVQVSVQGKAPAVRIGKTTMTDEEFQTEWERVAEVIGDVPEEELQTLWDNSMACQCGADVCLGLVELGIYWPKHPKFDHSVH